MGQWLNDVKLKAAFAVAVKEPTIFESTPSTPRRSPNKSPKGKKIEKEKSICEHKDTLSFILPLHTELTNVWPGSVNGGKNSALTTK